MFNADLADSIKQTIPFGTEKKRQGIGKFHDRLKSIDYHANDPMTGSPWKKLVQKDHIKLVGNKQSTGTFVHGKSVPRARPTMFWESQNLDLSVNLDNY